MRRIYNAHRFRLRSIVIYFIWKGSKDKSYACRHTWADHAAEVSLHGHLLLVNYRILFCRHTLKVTVKDWQGQQNKNVNSANYFR